MLLAEIEAESVVPAAAAAVGFLLYVLLDNSHHVVMHLVRDSSSGNRYSNSKEYV